MTDEQLMQEAEARVKAKRGFRSHVLSYIGVNFGLVVIYLVTSIGEYFWPVWCMVGWGMGLLIHGLHVYVKFPGKTLEQEIQSEYERLKSKVNTN